MNKFIINAPINKTIFYINTQFYPGPDIIKKLGGNMSIKIEKSIYEKLSFEQKLLSDLKTLEGLDMLTVNKIKEIINNYKTQEDKKKASRIIEAFIYRIQAEQEALEEDY